MRWDEKGRWWIWLDWWNLIMTERERERERLCLNRMTEGKTHNHPSAFSEVLESSEFIYMPKRRNHVMRRDAVSAS